MLRLELPHDILSRLERLSLRTGRPVKFYARQAILDYLDELEERYLSATRHKDEIHLYAESSDLF
ncbi:MAG: hypothetical protein O2948_11165 [Proteobacteria bacterium]|jgi:RHH-type transcriptional regulator, rel operon repressor / antitoxin RelB|nr:hypothetical protein [Pseudomonadota bacterium]